MPDYSAFLEPLNELRDCAICPRSCHVNRFSDKLGYCKSDAGFNISSICIHTGEEPPVSGEKGICNIFFTHCNLQCMFCQNYQISDNAILSESIMSIEEVIGRITDILDQGIIKVGFVSPSHYIPQVKIIITILRKLGYNPVFVFNTNAYDRPETIRSLEGMIDVYLPDLKYLDAKIARNYSDARDYPTVAMAAIREMYRQKGAPLHLDGQGGAVSGIIIRHLVLPNHIDNSLNVLRFIAEELSPRIHVSLMSQYYPTPQVSCHPKLFRPVKPEEYRKVTDEMERLDLCNGWIQELESKGNYRPDFRKNHPFE